MGRIMVPNHFVSAALSILIALCAGCQCSDIVASAAAAQDRTQPVAGENPFSRRIPAPELDGATWVNVEKPLKLADFRGRFVLLDFWTYCCINCMHVLPELKKLEHAYPNELAVIGIHSAKFEEEKDTNNIREAVVRYEIEHPVVNDANMQIWRTFGARAWPTLVLIDPAGDVVWVASGERTFDDIKEVIDLGLPYYRAEGLLKPAPRPATIEDPSLVGKPLRFPGKVLADAAGARLLIADSNHNRIIVASAAGRIQSVIGSGKIGREDGAFDKATFNHPQGMALVGDSLYIADTENHLLRKADLAKSIVTTIAGTGEKGHARPTTVAPLVTPIDSPWALWPHEQFLYVAMAGPHQIWRMPLDEREIAPYAGSGREAIDDGPLRMAAFAQPSGLASDGRRLFIADSEGSIIRSVPFDPRGDADSLVGPAGGTLFEFGDTDGVGERVRFQHPLGVAWQEGKLYVADTYNNKIKVVDVASRKCTTIAGTGQPGRDDAADGANATFNEPSGLAIAGSKLYVADTNNHAIRVVDLKAPYAISTLAIEGLAAPPKD